MLKELYHRVVPEPIRFPLGAFRRRVDDAWLRLSHRRPLPPRHLLKAVQMTPRLREYLDVGRRAATGLRWQLEARGYGAETPYNVLDFGCGLGRTLRFFKGTSWKLVGCDVDPQLITWCESALPGPRWQLNAPKPPLPFDDASFDVLWAVSVFTHFHAEEQRTWSCEMARVMRPGAVALLSLMGPHALSAFPQLHRRGVETLKSEGFFFEDGGDAFNERGAFHTRQGVERFFGKDFELEAWHEAGLDGFQDLAVLKRKPF